MPTVSAVQSRPLATPVVATPVKTTTQIRATSGGEVGVTRTTDLGNRTVEASLSNRKAGINVQGKSGEFGGFDTNQGPYVGVTKSQRITPNLLVEGEVRGNVSGLSATATLKQQLNLGNVQVNPYVQGTVKLGGAGSAVVGAEVKVDRFTGNFQQGLNGGFSAEVGIDIS
jgi:hypothetical protein